MEYTRMNCVSVRLLALFTMLFANYAMSHTIFEKRLENGRSVRVEIETKIAKPNGPPPSTDGFPPGAIVIVSDVEITDSRVIITHKDGSEKTVWRKRWISEPNLREWADILTTPMIMDVAEKSESLAILYSAEETDIDVIDLNADEGLNVNTHESLFRNSCLGIVKHGKIAWLDKLYVILERDSRATEIFCIDKGKCQKLYADDNSR